MAPFVFEAKVTEGVKIQHIDDFSHILPRQKRGPDYFLINPTAWVTEAYANQLQQCIQEYTETNFIISDTRALSEYMDCDQLSATNNVETTRISQAPERLLRILLEIKAR
jgi:hypothetical protein